ncbi:MAG: DUF58 domain-containing protein [Gemmataceae bacterium]
MLTPRGWWFLVLVLTVGAIGSVLVLRSPPTPALFLASLALVFWFGFEWVLFFWRARITVGRLTLERSIHHEGQLARTFWVGQTYQVNVTAKLPQGNLPYALCEDYSPTSATTIGSLRREGAITANVDAHWKYEFQPKFPGIVRFEGASVRLTDLQGFFFAERFVRQPVECVILPLPASSRGKRADKRANSLPPPGVHRFRRPGTGSELLELRDYRPGDPPRRIAWKLSSRREQLITREYESEVPLRCTLLIDASNATRLGPPGATALAGLTNIAAAVSGTALANRDLVGLAVTADSVLSYIPPARTSARLVQIFQTLARTSALAPEAPVREINRLISASNALATTVYPELMSPSVNRFAWWTAWLNPAPVYGARARSSPLRRWFQVFSTSYRGRVAARKRLATLLTVYYRLPPGAVSLLCEDDPTFSRWLQHFLAEHRVPSSVRVYDSAGRDRFVNHVPLQMQASALLRAVSRGRDNELFVLMGEYVERSAHLEPLLAAVRVARARHHQLMVIQPGEKVTEPGPVPDRASIEELLAFAERSRQARAWQEVRRAFGRLGVPVVAAGDGDPAALILYRLEQIRSAEGARRT